MNGNAVLYYKSAKAYFLPVKEIKEIEGFELLIGKYHYYFCAAEPPINHASSTRFARHKYLCNRFLETAGIPVPKSEIVDKEELSHDEFLEVISHLKFPLVAKPIAESKGKDVFCNLQTEDDLRAALKELFTTYDQVMVEEFYAHLNSYRVLVFNHRILGIIQRYPAHIVGDGTHTIAELVTLTNKERALINDFLGPILLDLEAHICLRNQGLTIDYVPTFGQRIVLAYTSNASRGGTYATLPKNRICRANHKLVNRIADVIDLKLVGIDIECKDLNTPIDYNGGVVIEANYIPSLRIHEEPLYGPPNHVSRKIIRSLIYRHPLAYLSSLYFNKQTAVYVRCFIVAIIITIILPLLAKG